jgi:hypothetical protein
MGGGYEWLENVDGYVGYGWCVFALFCLDRLRRLTRQRASSRLSSTVQNCLYTPPTSRAFAREWTRSLCAV